ncbi:GNAT family N-acetyltransferase [Massilia sp. TS11]|uniref:GNAT family N-acetyltransferase n=1 Tax=Massilia sp. TS11 TaxID=2908003 RepID=UPI001EDAC45A|nr:GNAT family N-acetyltransferase [Massilia sp. TS11]MCG2584711.1 N-acetyltransferase family protein [Massilia sp. TS11]
MTYTHRIATRDDLPRIVEIYNSTIASREVTADTEPVSVASREAWFQDHDPARRPLWTIHEGDDPAIVGWISYSNFYGRPAYAGTAEVSIYIDEAWRRKGVGRYALEQAIAFAPQIKVHTLLGFIFGHNKPSLGLFERFGFATWAHLPRVAILDGVERDLIILGKRVD